MDTKGQPGHDGRMGHVARRLVSVAMKNRGMYYNRKWEGGQEPVNTSLVNSLSDLFNFHCDS